MNLQITQKRHTPGRKKTDSGACDVSCILGGDKVLHRKVQNRLDLVELGREGLSKEAYDRLAQYLNFSTKQMAAILPVTERTIQRFKQNSRLSPEVSDHILQIAEVSAKGTKVFQDKEKFIAWLKAPCVAFAHQSPVSLLDSKFGVDMALDELGRIEHGIFS